MPSDLAKYFHVVSKLILQSRRTTDAEHLEFADRELRLRTSLEI